MCTRFSLIKLTCQLFYYELCLHYYLKPNWDQTAVGQYQVSWGWHYPSMPPTHYLIAQQDDLCYFCIDHLYFTTQITKKYSTAMCYPPTQLTKFTPRCLNSHETVTVSSLIRCVAFYWRWQGVCKYFRLRKLNRPLWNLDLDSVDRACEPKWKYTWNLILITETEVKKSCNLLKIIQMQQHESSIFGVDGSMKGANFSGLAWIYWCRPKVMNGLWLFTCMWIYAGKEALTLPIN